jgi:type I restriction enzyme M protein
MSNGDLNWIANFIWGIADDALRDLYVRGKYRDVILMSLSYRCLGRWGTRWKKGVP